MNKQRWADMKDDDDPIEPLVTTSKHGIKIKYVPPPLVHEDKTKPTVNSKK